MIPRITVNLSINLPVNLSVNLPTSRFNVILISSYGCTLNHYGFGLKYLERNYDGFTVNSILL